MKNLRLTAVLLCAVTGLSFSAIAQPLKFIDGIQFKHEAAFAANSAFSVSDVSEASKPAGTVTKNNFGTLATEACNMLQFKYSQLMHIGIESIANLRLFQFIAEWWSVAYRYGGTTKAGIDCSAFTGLLLSNVFGIAVPRTAREQYKHSQK